MIDSFRQKLTTFAAKPPYHLVDWSKALHRCEPCEGGVQLYFRLGFYVHDPHHSLQNKLLAHLQQGSEQLSIAFEAKVQAHQTQLPQVHVKDVRNIVAVASGKGGVGKTTTAVSLALALKQQGARVGLLDADIYGPNVATMLGCHEVPSLGQEGPFEPVMLHGLQTMSMAYLVDAAVPMIWRGPMISKALQQLLHLTQWQELDYLLVDMPPGTGDIPLTMAQKMPLVGYVSVTIPHEAAFQDLRRSTEMFNKMNINSFGVIENMSHYSCPSCGNVQSLFRSGVDDTILPKGQLLGKVPINAIHSISWAQRVPCLENPGLGSDLHAIYHQMATEIAIQIALQPRDYAQALGSIVVEPKSAS